ncbi:MAG TPA: HAMP domain-containing sensor histidine kinase [Actinomycetota bacterium]|nr:HAMP domain-containing sensor histidine kinase [Actinomycetota bacterium]
MKLTERLAGVSLRSHLTVVAAAAVALSLALASIVVFVATRAQLRAQLDSTLEALAARVDPMRESVEGRFAVSLDAGGLSGERGLVQFVPESGELPLPAEPVPPGMIAPGSDLVFVGPERLLPISDRARAVAAGREAPYFEDVDVGDVPMRVFTIPVAPGLAVQVAQPLDEIRSVLSRLALVLLGVTAAGALGAGALGRAVARSALHRVGRLTEVAEHVRSSKDFGSRMEVEGDDELSRLATSFNAMLDTLESSIASQRQLVADASHELRTPLTSIRTNVEVLARADDLPEEERAVMLTDITGQLDELTSLVSDLVELARDGSAPTQVETLRLDEIVDEVVDRTRRLVPGITITTTTEPTEVRGDRHRLERAVSNLLDNAGKWTPEGEEIEVTVAAGEVKVRDRGPGIDATDHPHIFDRFYRAPSARGKPGSGLGLAIAREVAVEHGGTVSASNALDGGAIFRLTLPAPS